jgi:hypothetical protein
MGSNEEANPVGKGERRAADQGGIRAGGKSRPFSRGLAGAGPAQTGVGDPVHAPGNQLVPGRGSGAMPDLGCLTHGAAGGGYLARDGVKKDKANGPRNNEPKPKRHPRGPDYG